MGRGLEHSVIIMPMMPSSLSLVSIWYQGGCGGSEPASAAVKDWMWAVKLKLIPHKTKVLLGGRQASSGAGLRSVVCEVALCLKGQVLGLWVLLS